MSRSWKFIMAPATPADPQTWWWVECRAGLGVRQSTAAFLTFLCCVTDARLRGFGVSDSFDVIRERRKAARSVLPTLRIPPARRPRAAR